MSATAVLIYSCIIAGVLGWAGAAEMGKGRPGFGAVLFLVGFTAGAWLPVVAS